MSPTRLAARLVVIVIGATVLSACGGESIVTVPVSTVPGYQQTNLVADVAGAANATDADLVNPWGLAAGPTTFWWVANNHSGNSTLYDGTGAKQSLTVALPSGAAPTGLVFNGTEGFVVDDGAGHSGPALFIFASEDGTISGWNPGVPPPSPSTQAFVAVDNSSQDAIYKGLALAKKGDANLLFATDFHNAKIDVFDDTFAPKTLAGNFSAPTPAGFAPFGIQAIDNKLYVTYAMQDANAEDDVPGAGKGVVNVFDTDGNLVKEFAEQGALNAPWGVTRAPDNFGEFSNAILVGNFGDGRINAFAADGASLGQLADTHGTPIAIDGLWALAFGNDGNAGPSTTLFFTAGTDDEAHGLFGSLEAVGSSGTP